MATPPRRFTDEEKEAWQELIGNAVPDLCGIPDRHQLEIAALLIARMRQTKFRFTKFRDLMNALDRLGMTPSGRVTMKPALGTHRPPGTPPPADAPKAKSGLGLREADD